MTPSAIYWITRLDSLCSLGGTVALLSLIACLVMCGIYGFIFLEKSSSPKESYDWEVADKWQRNIKKPFIAALAILAVFTSLVVFIPTTKEMAAIYVVPKIANSQQVQDISKEALDFAVDWMRDLNRKSTDHPASK